MNLNQLIINMYVKVRTAAAEKLSINDDEFHEAELILHHICAKVLSHRIFIHHLWSFFCFSQTRTFSPLLLLLAQT